jgi:hypothetical protein
MFADLVLDAVIAPATTPTQFSDSRALIGPLSQNWWGKFGRC